MGILLGFQLLAFYPYGFQLSAFNFLTEIVGLFSFRLFSEQLKMINGVCLEGGAELNFAHNFFSYGNVVFF